MNAEITPILQMLPQEVLIMSLGVALGVSITMIREIGAWVLALMGKQGSGKPACKADLKALERRMDKKFDALHKDHGELVKLVNGLRENLAELRGKVDGGR